MYQRLFITVYLVLYCQGVIPGFAQTSDLSIDTLQNTLETPALANDSTVLAVDTLALPTTNSGINSIVEYSARDSMVYDILNEQVYLYGEALVKQESIELTADIIRFNFGDKSVVAEPSIDSLGNQVGIPVFNEGDQEFNADKIAYNFDTRKGKISQLVTQEGEGYLVGKEVKKNELDELFAADAYYTTCDLDHPHFKIHSKKIKVVPDKVIVTGPANLVLADVPTPLVIPFAIFPLQKGRSSGIKLPSYGQSPNQGYYFRGGGVYLGINDYVDLALLGDVYTRGTWKLQGASNYNVRYRFRGNMSVEWGKFRQGDPLEDDFRINKTFKIRWSHSQDSKAHPSRTFSASVNAGSSRFDQTFLSNSQDVLTNTFGSNITYNKSFSSLPLRLGVSASHSQNTGTRRISVRLPDVSLNLTKRVYPFKRKVQVGSDRWYEKITLGYSSNLRNNVESADSTFFRKVDPDTGVGRFSLETLDDARYGMRHSVPVNFSTKILKYLNFSSGLNITQRWYTQRDQLEWDPTVETETTINEEGVEEVEIISEGRVVESIRNVGFRAPTDFSFNAGFNTRLYGMFNFKEGGHIKAIRHVMNPNVSYNFRPDFENFWGSYTDSVQTEINQLEEDFRVYGIYNGNNYGGPSFGKSQSISFSLDNNFEMKVRSKNDTLNEFQKIKLLESLSMNMSHNFAAEEFKWSNLSVTARNTFFEKFNMSFRSTFDPYALDEEANRINVFAKDRNQGLFRMRNMNFSIGGRINSETLKEKGEDSTDRGTEEERNDVFRNREDFVDYDIPWAFNFGYNINLIRDDFVENGGLADSLRIVQTLNVGGDISITPNWKLDIQTGWDFQANELAFTRINIFRDLHCWDMSFLWVPVGTFQSYEFRISVKSSLLQDLKLQRRRQWFD